MRRLISNKASISYFDSGSTKTVMAYQKHAILSCNTKIGYGISNNVYLRI